MIQTLFNTTQSLYVPIVHKYLYMYCVIDACVVFKRLGIGLKGEGTNKVDVQWLAT